ncbi:uncharacterized protein Boh1 [Drosophila tropicalis]|uniref:uncharacterized protein Boh1 n=1 Tax=Drosophila tropicalis TaxID=46794 RepID=UPI0035ABACCA
MAKQRSVHAKVTPINVPVYELPEFVCVETRWVTKENRDAMDLEKILPTNRLLKLHRPTKDNYTMTMALPLTTTTVNPNRERFVQTETKQTSDKAIQCGYDEEWENWITPPQTSPPDINRDESIFLNFVSENTSMFPNGMLECMICGEVAMALVEHQNHMTGHRKPQQLCHYCGRKIHHWHWHKYKCVEYPKAMKVKRRQVALEFKCPHLQCQVVAKSASHLRQHMARRHLNRPAYSCHQCKCRFETGLDFLLHRQDNTKCLKAKPNFVYRHKGAVLEANRCSLCLKRFQNKFKCSIHRIKCLKAHLTVCAGLLLVAN